jgi:hypothetical protein
MQLNMIQPKMKEGSEPRITQATPQANLKQEETEITEFDC